MYVQHSVMDDSRTGFHGFLSLASYCNSGKYSAVRPDYDLFNVSLPLDIYESVHRRINANRPADSVYLCETFQVHAQISPVRYRLLHANQFQQSNIFNH